MKLQRNGIVNELSNIKDTFTESFQQQIPVLHQSICIFKTGLSSVSDEWVKYKEKVRDVCNSKLRFTELKGFIHQKGAEKLVRGELCICSFLELRIFGRRYDYRYGFLLQLVNTFTVDMEEYYPRCYKVNFAKTIKNLVVSFYALCSQIICMYIADWHFKSHIDLVMYIIGSD